MVVEFGRTKAVLFDKDGTLFDFQKTWGPLGAELIAELADGDAALADRLADAAGYDLATGRYRAESPIVSGSGVELVMALAAVSPTRSPAEIGALAMQRAAGAVEHGPTPAVDDLPALLEQLRSAGMALGVATHDQEASARAQLEAVGALAPFSFVAGADSGYALKPDPAMLTAFAAAVGVAPGEIVMVGDSPADLGMGAASGALASVGVLSGPASEALLAPLADIVLANIGALPELLGL